MSVIEDFVQHYDNAREFYLETAKTAEQQCREVLELNHVPALVTSRAKCPVRLREKLDNRNPELQYETAADIHANIYDLAGVRVAVYLPGHIQKVARLLQTTFIPHSVKVYNPPRNPPTDTARDASESNRIETRHALPGVDVQQITRPSGYRAIHLHAELPPTIAPHGHIPTGASLQVEIQITSLLMHAWSEVEHDLAYKCVEEALSPEEASMLGEVQESVATGESLLRRLEDSRRARRREQKRGLQKL